MVLDKILSLSNKYEDYVLDIRRKIHQNPELSFKEVETSRLILKELEKMGIQKTGGIAGTGIMAELSGKEKGKTILLRAEMDALPLEEKSDYKYKSQNKGIMHSCGHDVHSANLLGVAKILRELKDDFKGTVKFMFQPGEEKGKGSKKMLDAGILENEEVHGALALHLMPLKKGIILLTDKNITSFSDGFTIKIYGKTAHSSNPGTGIDAINIASHIVVALNSVISEYLNPQELATFSIGKIEGGRANNIIADYVELKGMIRAVTRESRDLIRGKLKSISEGIGKTFDGRVEVEIREGYLPVINNIKTTGTIRRTFKENYFRMIEDIDEDIFNEGDIEKYVINYKPLLTAEDFGFIAEKIPSTYYMIGIGNYGSLHSSKFYVDEKYIKLCTRTMTLAVLELLK